MPDFEECVVVLLQYVPGMQTYKGKEMAPPSLLQDVDRASGHLHLVLSNEDLESFKSTPSGALAKSTLFDLGKVCVDIVGHSVYLYCVFLLLTILFISDL